VRACGSRNVPSVRTPPGPDPPTGFCFSGATFRPMNRAQSEMLSHGTNQARRGSRRRPDPPGCEAQGGPGLVICPVRQQAQMTN
jgi:hypothetical protein